MEKLTLIANPAASGFTGGTHRQVASILGSVFEVDIQWPTHPDQTTELTAHAAASGTSIIAGMGGDGVVNRIAAGLVGSDAALAIIPAGTTNVLARILHIPNDAVKAARMLAKQPTPRPLSLISVTTDSGQHRYGTFAVGLGLDADVVEHAERNAHRKRSMGGLHYGQTAVRLFLTDFRRRLPNMTVHYGDESIRAVGVMIQLHDPYTYFGPMPLRVASEPSDVLDVLVVERISVRRLPGVLTRAVFGGDMNRIPNLRVIHGVDEMTIDADLAVPLQGDGELFEKVAQASIRFRPNAINAIY